MVEENGVNHGDNQETLVKHKPHVLLDKLQTNYVYAKIQWTLIYY